MGRVRFAVRALSAPIAFDTFFKETCESAMRNMRKGGQCKPTLFVVGGAALGVAFLPTNVPDPMLYITPIVQDSDPDYYAFVSEFWTIAADTKDMETIQANYKRGDIAKRPDRKEALVILGRTKKGESASKFYLITRDKDGKAIDFKEPDDMGEFVAPKLP
jgi:hypothetical protein